MKSSVKPTVHVAPLDVSKTFIELGEPQRFAQIARGIRNPGSRATIKLRKKATSLPTL